MLNTKYEKFILTVDEGITIANEVFNVPITECELLIREFDIIRATERIFTWLKNSPYLSYMTSCSCMGVSSDRLSDIKNAVVLYCISYHKDDTADSSKSKEYELVAYNYLKNRNLVSFR